MNIADKTAKNIKFVNITRKGTQAPEIIIINN